MRSTRTDSAGRRRPGCANARRSAASRMRRAASEARARAVRSASHPNRAAAPAACRLAALGWGLCQSPHDIVFARALSIAHSHRICHLLHNYRQSTHCRLAPRPRPLRPAVTIRAASRSRRSAHALAQATLDVVGRMSRVPLAHARRCRARWHASRAAARRVTPRVRLNHVPHSRRRLRAIAAPLGGASVT